MGPPVSYLETPGPAGVNRRLPPHRFGSEEHIPKPRNSRQIARSSGPPPVLWNPLCSVHRVAATQASCRGDAGRRAGAFTASTVTGTMALSQDPQTKQGRKSCQSELCLFDLSSPVSRSRFSSQVSSQRCPRYAPTPARSARPQDCSELDVNRPDPDGSSVRQEVRQFA